MTPRRRELSLHRVRGAACAIKIGTHKTRILGRDGGLEVLILQVLCVILMCWAFIGEGSRKILNLCEPLLQVLARMPRTARKATNHLSFQ